MSWLSGLQPLRRLRVRSENGLPGWLVEGVTPQFAPELPTTVTVQGYELTAFWDVHFDAFSDHVVARARAKRSSTRHSVVVSATAAGHGALLDWLSDLHPVSGMTLEDDGEGELLQHDLALAGYFPQRRHASRGPLPTTEGAQFGEVKAGLTLRSTGRLDLTLWLGADRIEVPGSWMASPWHDTLMALAALLGGDQTADPVWVTDDPDFYQLHLRRIDGENVSLHVTATHMYEHSLRIGDIDNLAQEQVVRLRDLANAFLSATQAILAATPPDDLQRRWPSRNPGRALRALKRALEADTA